MPKGGFKSITINETVYDKFHSTYMKNKSELAMKGVNSFAGYIQYCFEELMLQQTHMRFKLVFIENNLVALKDTKLNKVINVEIMNNMLYCTECKSGQCMHIGFCWSLHKLYPITVK